VREIRGIRCHDGGVNPTLLAILAGFALLVLTTGIGIVSGWMPKPAFLRPWHVATTLVVLVAATAAATVLLTPDNPPDPPDSPGPLPSGPLTPAMLAPDLAGRLLLVNDDGDGTSSDFSARLDGSHRQLVQTDVGEPPPAIIPGGTDLVMSRSIGTDPYRERLAVTTISGTTLRNLTHPGRYQEDTYPSIAGPTVYFLRAHLTPIGQSTALTTRYEIMRVPLDGTSAEQAVRTGVQLRSVSVSADGRTLAGVCPATDAGPVQGCVLRPASTRFTRLPGSTGASVSDVTLSPDGHWIAYSSVIENPYGTSQIYLYNTATHQVTELTRLDGTNDQPAWPPHSRRTCIAFHHATTADSAIYLACLTPTPRTAKAVDLAQYPVWFP
jgi:hypothetical protein